MATKYYICTMKYKNILITLFICAYSCLHAQVKVLDPDMITVKEGDGKAKGISDILPMGNWKANKRMDSLKVGDTLVLVNDNMAREYNLNFIKSGEVKWYKQHMNDHREKDGTTSVSFDYMWDVIGFWKVEDGGKIDISIDVVNSTSNGSNTKTVFKEINSSYTVVKLLAVDRKTEGQ